MTRHYLIPLAVLAVAAPAVAQLGFSDSFNFLKAVREADGEKATELLTKQGKVIINAADSATGETALHIVTTRRDALWLGFLLQPKFEANPNVRDARGNTPLMLATTARWAEGVQILLARRANVDAPNSTGETPLARAVLNNDIATVRLLLASNANPARADNAGFTPKDLARRDPRLSAILKELEAAKPVTSRPIQGPR